MINIQNYELINNHNIDKVEHRFILSNAILLNFFGGSNQLRMLYSIVPKQ